MIIFFKKKLHSFLYLPITIGMIKNIITSIVNRLSNSENAALNRLGQMININYEMSTNREKFIAASYDYGSSNKMNNILIEMKYLIDGGYYGNKDYLFSRMNFLILEGFNLQCSSGKPTISVNNISLEKLNERSRKLPARNKKGQFVSKRTAARRRKK